MDDLEKIDNDHPTAEILRSLFPSIVVMRPRAYDELLSKIYLLYEKKMRQKSKELTMIENGEEYSRVLKVKRSRKLAFAFLSLVLIAILLVTFTLAYPRRKKAPVYALSATVCLQLGSFQIREPGSSWRNISQGENVSPFSRIRTGENSLGALMFPNGSIIRLSDRSEAQVMAIQSDAVRIKHIRGSTYHRASPKSVYIVESRDVTAKGSDTAFTFENPTPDNLEILSVFKIVDVEIGNHPPIPIYEGEVMVISLSGRRKAEKIAVSKEKLEDPRLSESVRMDAENGYPTGIYEKLDVPVLASGASMEEKAQILSENNHIQLKGVTVGCANSFEWFVSPDVEYDFLALLRKEGSVPVYPDDEIARYYDPSISGAIDNGVTIGKTYQYCLVGVRGGEPVVSSNTVVITMTAPQEAPRKAKLELVASQTEGGVLLEWSLNGVSSFWGYVVEKTLRTREKEQPRGAGSVQTYTVKSSDILDSFLDRDVQPGGVYVYRIGLIVEDSVILYSRSVEISVKSKGLR